MAEFIKDLSFRRLLDSLKLTPKRRLVEFGGKYSLVDQIETIKKYVFLYVI